VTKIAGGTSQGVRVNRVQIRCDRDPLSEQVVKGRGGLANARSVDQKAQPTGQPACRGQQVARRRRAADRGAVIWETTPANASQSRAASPGASASGVVPDHETKSPGSVHVALIASALQDVSRKRSVHLEHQHTTKPRPRYVRPVHRYPTMSISRCSLVRCEPNYAACRN